MKSCFTWNRVFVSVLSCGNFLNFVPSILSQLQLVESTLSTCNKMSPLTWCIQSSRTELLQLLFPCSILILIRSCWSKPLSVYLPYHVLYILYSLLPCYLTCEMEGCIEMKYFQTQHSEIFRVFDIHGLLLLLAWPRWALVLKFRFRFLFLTTVKKIRYAKIFTRRMPKKRQSWTWRHCSALAKARFAGRMGGALRLCVATRIWGVVCDLRVGALAH